MSGSRGSSPPSIADQLFESGFRFDFFQAVRLLQRLQPDRLAIGGAGPPRAESVRLRAHISLSFPPSSIYEIQRPDDQRPMPELSQAFLGLVGPSGILPRTYTELLCRLARESRDSEAGALRDWLDLFHHRLTSLFYRCWEKYRFPLAYERGEDRARDPDLFTRTLYSLVGQRPRSQRERLVVKQSAASPEPLARIPDLGLLYYSGLLSHRPRSALGLEAILRDYFALPVRVRQFQGEWLLLDESNRTRIGDDTAGGHNQLGLSAIVGDRVWEVRHKIRVCLGPLTYQQFVEFLPDREPVPERKAVFLMAHLIRLYVGPEIDFDVQLILAAPEVPETRLADTAHHGSQLGWNTWLRTAPFPNDADEAVFEGVEVFELQ